jgi:hypothetical protein
MTTTTTNERMITHCGITAPAQCWKDFGFTVYSNTDTLSHDDKYGLPKYLELLGAIQASGHNDERALAWLYRERAAQSEERTRSTATARLAEAITELTKVAPRVSEHFAETAQTFLAAATKLSQKQR